MLSKMLSQRSLNMPLTPKGMESLSSFILADPAPVVRRNPIGLRQTPSGLRMARVIGERGRVMDDMMLKEVMNYLQKNEGDYELPTDFPASERQFELFRNVVLQPYLIAVESNRALIKYLNDVLIPHMNRLVDEGSYSKKGLGEAGGITMTKAKIKEMIARRYDTIVSRLATSCQDFYMGRNEALIAHPAFLYPQMQYILLPPPLKLTGGSRAEVFLYQAGETPKYGVAVDKIGDKEVGKVVAADAASYVGRNQKAQGDADELTFPVARVNNRPIDFANVVNAEVVKRSLGAGNVQELLVIAGRFWRDATRRLFKRKGTANSANPLTPEQLHALNELNKVANDLQLSGSMEPVIAALSNVKDGERSLERLPMAVAIEVNIGGIKPRPIRWPETLICCMMKALSDNADQIIELTARVMETKKPNSSNQISTYCPLLSNRTSNWSISIMAKPKTKMTTNKEKEVTRIYTPMLKRRLKISFLMVLLLTTLFEKTKVVYTPTPLLLLSTWPTMQVICAQSKERKSTQEPTEQMHAKKPWINSKNSQQTQRKNRKMETTVQSNS